MSTDARHGVAEEVNDTRSFAEHGRESLTGRVQRLQLNQHQVQVRLEHLLQVVQVHQLSTQVVVSRIATLHRTHRKNAMSPFNGFFSRTM